jgi:allophanate hydrolase subunit 1
MTKVQRHFHLERTLDEALMQQIADANSLYGIEWIKVLPSREDLLVEFDATRLRSSDVEAALQRAGIPASAV